MNFRYRLMQFMSGRYGNDNLNYFLFISAAVISVTNILLRAIFLRYFFLIQILVYVIVGYAFFRLLSRNHEARRRENYWFKEKVNFLKRKREIYEKQKNDKSHVYRKCPSCKAVLRLPHRIGTHTTVCPRCNKEFKVKVKK